jgi:hypothetical protein
MKILSHNHQEWSGTGGVFSPSLSTRSYGQEENGDDPESPHGMRSLRCGSDSPFKTLAEASDRLLLTRQYSTFYEHCQTRMWIETPQGLAGESTGLNNFSIRTQPRIGHGAQAGIGRLHPSKLDLFKQLGERVGLGDGGNCALQCLVAGVHDQFVEQEPGPRGSPQLPQAPPPLPGNTQPSVPPTPNEEICFSNFVVLHFGQAACVEPYTNSSNR